MLSNLGENGTLVVARIMVIVEMIADVDDNGNSVDD